MSNLRDVRVTVALLVKLEKSVSEMFVILNTTYSSIAMKHRTCCQGYIRYKDDNQRLKITDILPCHKNNTLA